MIQHPESVNLLQRAAQRASQRRFFVAHTLSAYQSLHGIAADELAEFLECSVEELPRLALCRQPKPGTSDFRSQVERIAAYVGINAVRFVQILREVESVTTLQDMRESTEGDSRDGFLMAARDHNEENADEESTPNASDHGGHNPTKS